MQFNVQIIVNNHFDERLMNLLKDFGECYEDIEKADQMAYQYAEIIAEDLSYLKEYQFTVEAAAGLGQKIPLIELATTSFKNENILDQFLRNNSLVKDYDIF